MSKKSLPSWREIFSDLLSFNELTYNPDLAVDNFDENFRSGLVRGLFAKRDQRLVGRVFEALTSHLNLDDFRNQVVALYRLSLEQRAIQLRSEIAHSEGPHLARLEIIREFESRKVNASWDNFTSYCELMYTEFCPWQPAHIACDNFFKDNYLLFSIAELLFEHLLRHQSSRFIVPQESLVASEYVNAGVDLFKTDAQFNSYGLLTVVKEMIFSDIKPLEPFDSRVGKYLTLDSEALTVLDLVAFEKEGIIGSLSFRPRFNAGLRSRKSLSIAMEAVERGALFDFSKLNKPEVTKLYSIEYDTLWVNIKVGDITFEEMVQDFVVEGDYIVTQVIHLQHSKNNGVDFINHIDHEYIYYTLDEYQSRLTNPNQKGEARARIKTFKVDDATIPFTLSDGRWFLYTLLERHFQKIELIREYFQKVI